MQRKYRLIALVVPCLALCSGASAQQAPVFTVTRQLAIETVFVRDKEGKPVEGLTAKDFAMTEDGVPQEIKFLDYEKLDEGAPSPTPTVKREPMNSRLTSTEIASETPGNPLYRNRRLLVLYFDMTSIGQAVRLRAIAAAQQFIKQQMTAADLIAVISFSSGSVRVLEDFTDDRPRLTSVLKTLGTEGEQETQGNTSDASAPDTGAAFGQDDSEFNIFNTDRQLAALQTAVRMLSHLTERKGLLYFSGGLQLNGLDNQAQLHATINEAVRSGVAFYPIDARGLSAGAPIGDATRGSPGGAGMYTGASATAFQSGFQASQDPLWTLAADTGGKALLDSNDLTKAMAQAQQAIGSYYVLGYYPSNEKPDGKYRRVRVTLNGGLSASLDYRQGYFARKEFSKFNAADKERQLEEAFALSDPVTELTIAMEVDYFQMSPARYFIPVAVKIPGRELAIAQRGGAQKSVIDFLYEVKDEFGGTVANSRDKVELKLSGSTAAELARRPIQYETGFVLLPGPYVIKLLARDAETGRIGTYQAAFVVPNLNKVSLQIPLSSVVLSGQKRDVKQALYSVKHLDETGNPLVLNGEMLIPSVTRVFSKRRDLLVFFHAYQHGDAPARPLVAFVGFYRGGTRVFESRPFEVKQAPDRLSKATPVTLAIPLAHLAPGTYSCQLTVLDPTARKAAFWQAPVRVVQ